MSQDLHERLDAIWSKAAQENPCACGNDDKWEQEVNGRIRCNGCKVEVASNQTQNEKVDILPFPNMEDIIYCHSEELAHELFDFFRGKGHPVGLSTSEIHTGTHGEQIVNRLDVYKKNV